MKDLPSLITVGADSRPYLVATSIATLVREGRPVTVQAIGSAAAEQAMKAAAVAWRSLKAEGISVACSPFFAEVTVDSQKTTSVRLEVVGGN